MGKNIVILCDGTGNSIGARERTNIVDMFAGLTQADDQMVYYDAGVGTASGARTEWATAVMSTIKKALGAGVRRNVEQAYESLMNNYADGDRVFLFGFSRGAHTARVIAGVVKKVGLLRPGNFQLIQPAVDLHFKKNPREDIDAFRRIATRDCNIHFVGVFDTVASMAWIFKKNYFHDNRLHPDIPHGVHALAIDERRRKFLPSLWEIAMEQDAERIVQVWFAGVHSNVGGWYENRDLSAIALRWMLKHAQNAGLFMSDNLISKAEEDAKPGGVQHESFNLMWRILGGEQRCEIPEGAKAHESVRQRLEEKKYDPPPPNLPHDVTYVADP